jgi:hypothetical protein
MIQTLLRPGFKGSPVKTTSLLCITGVGYVIVLMCIRSVVVLQPYYTMSDLCPLLWCDVISSKIYPWYAAPLTSV